MRKAEGELVACLSRLPEPELIVGRQMTLDFLIARGGFVAAAQVRSESAIPMLLTSCLRYHAVRWRFKPTETRCRVRIPLSFERLKRR